VQVAGDFHKVIVENDTVRVLEFRDAPGSKTAVHGHPNVMASAVTEYKVQFDDSNGESLDLELIAGRVMATPPFEHAITNMGDTEAVVILIEIKG
jgi:hypothetical protein